jgi:NAD(P)H-binding
MTELAGMTAAITGSGLDWTIARITNPTDKPESGTVQAGFLGVDKVGSAMSRADIAAFLVGQLTDHSYLRAARDQQLTAARKRPWNSTSCRRAACRSPRDW